MTISASQIPVVKGLTTITEHHKSVHVLIESSPKCMNVFILGHTSELKPGNSNIEVVIQNRAEKDMRLKQGKKIGTVITANIVPTMQVSSDLDVDGPEVVSSMPAQVASTNILWDTSDCVRNNLNDILQKLNLSGMQDWKHSLQKAAQDLICKCACIFFQNDLDLGNTSIVKHSIKVNDPAPFTEQYRHIPPGMYGEVKVHI